MSTHIGYFYEQATDIDQNTGLSIQDYIDSGWQTGETEGSKWTGRQLTAGETPETTPDIVVEGNPVPKNGYTPPCHIRCILNISYL